MVEARNTTSVTSTRWSTVSTLRPICGALREFFREKFALEAIEWAKKIAPNATEVLADRLYTMKFERFNRRLHQEVMRVVTKLDKRQVPRVRTLMFGTNQHELIENCGTFFPAWLDEDLHKPPPELQGKARTEWFDKRAQYRYSVDEVLDDGTGTQPDAPETGPASP